MPCGGFGVRANETARLFLFKIMARPKKKNADYFSHDADMRNDNKIKALRRKFGIVGYGVWCMLLENLTDKDFFKYEYNDLNIELLSGDFDIEPEILKEIINYCVMVNLLEIKDGFLYSQKLIDRFESLLNRRKGESNPPKKELSTSETPQIEVIDVGNPQSKVKYSKVKENKEIYIYTEKQFLERWKAARLYYDKQPTNISKLESFEIVNLNKIIKTYTPKQIDEAIAGFFTQNTYKSTRLRPTHFLELNHFEKYLTCYETGEKLFPKQLKKVERL